jgi:tubulin epsilon
MDVSGAGNNFANGHYHYGPLYRERFEESLRRNVEHCDSLQSFVIVHSLGGGTGSGVGTYVLGLVEDIYPDVCRFSTCIFPSEDDDVVTSPYNSMLASRQLSDHAHAVLPLENESLLEFAKLEQLQLKKKQSNEASSRETDERGTGFSDMNDIAARMLCHLTSSSRFNGELNVDMNEICTNLVPFPRMQFLMTALSPQRRINGMKSSSSRDGSKQAVHRAFSDILGKAGQLSGAVPCSLVGSAGKSSNFVTLASAFLARGAVPLSDFLDCVTSARTTLKFPSWNPDACKIGICGVPAPGEQMSILAIYNNSGFSSVLSRQRSRFQQLYKRKAMLHHYTEYVDAEEVGEAERVVASVISEYESVESPGSKSSIDSVLFPTIFSDFSKSLFPSF